jgi:hypothetical protein
MSPKERALLQELQDLNEESSVEVYEEDRSAVEALYAKGLLKFVSDWERTQMGFWRANVNLTTKGWST